MTKVLIVALGLTMFAVAACAPVAPLPGAPIGQCSAKGLDNMIGRIATPSLIDRAKRRSGASVARVLRPGGLAVIAVWENPGGAGPAQLFQEAAQRFFPDRPLPSPMARLFNSPSLLDKAFREAGLEPEAVHEVAHAWPAAPAEWFRENAKLAFGWSPLWRDLDDAQREAFADEAAALARCHCTYPRRQRQIPRGCRGSRKAPRGRCRALGHPTLASRRLTWQ